MGSVKVRVKGRMRVIWTISPPVMPSASSSGWQVRCALPVVLR